MLTFEFMTCPQPTECIDPDEQVPQRDVMGFRPTIFRVCIAQLEIRRIVQYPAPRSLEMSVRLSKVSQWIIHLLLSRQNLDPAPVNEYIFGIQTPATRYGIHMPKTKLELIPMAQPEICT
ncbi:hypothetical protein SDC9_200559 [bioreactor metagenome]|uniref:Uncharacterized protein n=1 Tax=bioreactor metagenome TaxID=1076179 RepID=A0A645IPB5_9ZZZZ